MLLLRDIHVIDYQLVTMSGEEVPPSLATTTAAGSLVTTAVSVPAPLSTTPLASGLPPETIQRIAGAVAAILQPTPSSVNPLLIGPSSAGEAPGPSSRPSDPISGKFMVNAHAYLSH